MKIKITLLVILVLLCSIASVAAIGVAPGKTEIAYDPGKEVTISVNLVNDDPDVNVGLSFPGYDEYIELVEFDGSRAIIKLRIPEFDTPGEKVARLVFTEKAPPGAQIAALASINHPIIIMVPYETPFFSVQRWSVDGGQPGGSIPFSATIDNQGLKSALVEGTITIKDPNNKEYQATFNSKTQLPARDKFELEGSWAAPVDLPLGRYTTTGEISYDGPNSPITLEERNFFVGSKLVTIDEISPTQFKPDTINKITLKVSSKWSQSIDVAANIELKQNDQVVSQVKSSAQQVSSQRTQNLDAFVDTNGIVQGNYLLTVTLEYDGEPSTKTIPVTVTARSPEPVESELSDNENEPESASDEEESSSLTWIIVAVGIVIILVFGFIYFKKRSEEEDDDDEL